MEMFVEIIHTVMTTQNIWKANIMIKISEMRIIAQMGGGSSCRVVANVLDCKEFEF